MNSLEKQLLFFNTFKDIISIFGQTEIGINEVDVQKLAIYLDSNKFFADSFNLNTEEEIQQYITKIIEQGFPCWMFLKCSNWTKNMIEKSFKIECEQEKQEMEKIYKCLTCQYYSCTQTSIGLFEKCNYTSKNINTLSYSRKEFRLKKTCQSYKKQRYKGDIKNEII